MNRKFFFIFLMFLVQTVVSVSGLQATSDDGQIRYHSYVNNTLGFSVDVPGEYQSEVNGTALVFSGRPGSDQWHTTINFQAIQASGQQLVSFVADLKSQWQDMDSYRLLSEQTGALDKQKAVRLLVEYRVENDQELIRQEQFVVQHTNYFYLIAYTAPATLFDLYHAPMSRAVDTFHIIAPETNHYDARALQAFIHSVQEFREQNSIDGISGWNNYADPQVLEFFNTLSEDIWPEGERNSGWAYFFSSSMSSIGQLLSPLPVVGFYHPWSDVWIITQWQKEPEPQILSAEIVSGEWVRNHGIPPFDFTPAWLRGSGFRPDELSRAIIANLLQFDDAVHADSSWQKTLNLSGNSSLLEDVNYPAVSNALLFSWLRAMDAGMIESENKVLNDLLAGGQRFLTAGKNGRIDSMISLATGTIDETLQAVRAFKPDFFRSLNPVYWTADEKWATLYLIPGSNTDFCLSLRFLQDSAAMQLQRVDLLYFPEIMKQHRQGRL